MHELHGAASTHIISEKTNVICLLMQISQIASSDCKGSLTAPGGFAQA
jgi:hypothetical protein